MGYITIKRKGYRRKDGTYVKPTTYKRRDVGKRGRGPKVIPPLQEGELSKHGYRFTKPARVRHLALSKSVKEDGYRKVLGRLIALQVLFKRTKPRFSKIAASDRMWLVKKFGGSW